MKSNDILAERYIASSKLNFYRGLLEEVFAEEVKQVMYEQLAAQTSTPAASGAPQQAQAVTQAPAQATTAVPTQANVQPPKPPVAPAAAPASAAAPQRPAVAPAQPQVAQQQPQKLPPTAKDAVASTNANAIKQQAPTLAKQLVDQISKSNNPQLVKQFVDAVNSNNGEMIAKIAQQMASKKIEETINERYEWGNNAFEGQTEMEAFVLELYKHIDMEKDIPVIMEYLETGDISILQQRDQFLMENMVNIFENELIIEEAIEEGIGDWLTQAKKSIGKGFRKFKKKVGGALGSMWTGAKNLFNKFVPADWIQKYGPWAVLGAVTMGPTAAVMLPFLKAAINKSSNIAEILKAIPVGGTSTSGKGGKDGKDGKNGDGKDKDGGDGGDGKTPPPQPTPETTPETTPDTTPEATPQATPQATPVPTPVVAPKNPISKEEIKVLTSLLNRINNEKKRSLVSQDERLKIKELVKDRANIPNRLLKAYDAADKAGNIGIKENFDSKFSKLLREFNTSSSWSAPIERL